MDTKALELELSHAREARRAALAASTEVEDVLLAMQQPDFGKPRIAFFIAGLDEDRDTTTAH